MSMSVGNGGGGSARPMADINVTPMVDVMLVLLIIFMVTAPLIEQGVKVDLPKTKAPNIDSAQPKLILGIDKNRHIFLGETEIPYAELKDKLSTNERIKREKELYLRADFTLPYGFVVDIMAIMKDAGVESLGMVTDPAGTGK
jgi:biopolymer transport protein TolR